MEAASSVSQNVMIGNFAAQINPFASLFTPSPNRFFVTLIPNQAVKTQATFGYDYVTAIATIVPKSFTFLPLLLLAGFGALRRRKPGCPYQRLRS